MEKRFLRTTEKIRLTVNCESGEIESIFFFALVSRIRIKIPPKVMNGCLVSSYFLLQIKIEFKAVIV